MLLLAALTAILAFTLFAGHSLSRLARWPTLRAWTPVEPARWPRVSVIVPSRNEAETVERATLSLLSQDYPELEVVAIDDRSTDDTGPILDRLAAADPRLKVVHVRDLPAGWLGKTHAMHLGAAAAAGEWLLFTDGDVIFERDALRRAVAFAEASGLGHFVAFPSMLTSGFLERAFVGGAFGIAFGLITQMHRLHVARSRAFVGVGAFGLVRRAAYDSIGGHSKLRLEVGDDVKLGLILRRSGVPQGALNSGGLVSVKWQNGFLGCILGLEKNGFAGVEWNTAVGVAGVVACFALAWLPWVAVIDAPEATTRAVGVVAVAAQLAIAAGGVRRLAGGSGLEAMALPVAFTGLCVAMARSIALALWRGGIRWRDTFYPLDELRRGCVRERDWDRRNAVGWTPPFS